MKIGVVTIYDVPNYGAMLQSYALQRELTRMGHDAVLLNYCNPHLRKVYQPEWIPPKPVKLLRNWRCRRFVRQNLRIHRRRLQGVSELASISNGFDLLITGSDQVWFTGPVQGYDPVYFLDQPAIACPKISYAASAGATTHFGNDRERVAESLSRYAAISVRDEFTESLVRGVTSGPIARVVDPVLLYDFAAEVKSRLTTRPSAAPYLAVFGNLNESDSHIVREVARARGLSIVTLQYRFEGSDLRLAAPSPWNWLSALRNASAIATSYFHGTVVALRFGVPVISFPTPNRVSKVTALLNDAGLTSALQPQSAADALIAFDTQADKGNELISQQIRESRQWLTTVIRQQGERQ